MFQTEMHTQDISMVMTDVGGIWKLISAFAAVIMVPLLFKSFYESLA